MSDLQRAFAKAKLSGYPATLPPDLSFNVVDEDDGEEETDSFTELPGEDDSSSASSASSTGTVIPTRSRNLFARPQGYVSVQQNLVCSKTDRLVSPGFPIEGRLSKFHGPLILKESYISNPRPKPPLQDITLTLHHL